MQRTGISSIQLMLTLFISMIAVFMIQSYNSDLSQSFLINIFCALSAVVLTLLYLVPSLVIRNKTKLDFFSFVHSASPSAEVFTAAFYSIFYIYVIVFFLLKYNDVFLDTINPEAGRFAVALIMLVVGAYAAHKGIGAVSRCGIFIFAFSLITFALVFCGNISKLDFDVNSLFISSYGGSVTSSASLFMQLAFIAVIFSSVAENTKKFRVRHIIITVFAGAVLMLLSIFFMWFVLGTYGTVQTYQMFLLSKAAEIGVMGGFDSFFLALSAMTVFVVISLGFISIDNAMGKRKKTYMTVMYGVIAYVLYICAENISFIKEILVSHTVFNALTFAAAVLIPSIYLIIFRRRLNV